ncbi:MAG: helix-turn-helix transcriptional regulator [Alphaproteobacteria bacterium]|nr:helix-turn-helix transcriptional regulator [Alphaproteobacteria bacterium]
MPTTNALAEIAALIGDPARAGMLLALMDGRARPASELALEARIMPQTASGHLAKLVAAGLLEVHPQGRNRFYRIAGPAVADAIEAIGAIAGPHAVQPPQAPASAAWRRDPDLRFCRTCYDHLAGQVGMAVTDALTHESVIEPAPGKDWHVTEHGEHFCRRVGIDIEAARAASAAGRRHFARQCLDWSERRPHIAGAFGAAIADLFFRKGWTVRSRRGRMVILTPEGRRALVRVFGAVDPALAAPRRAA